MTPTPGRHTSDMILEVLDAHDGPVECADIYEEVDRPYSTTIRHLKALDDDGAIEYHADLDAYTLPGVAHE